LMDRYKDGCM
jgi:hypothetical protein